MAKRKPATRGPALDAIIQAAVDCFYKQGFEATSVQEVVDRARVTKGAFYHYFDRKEDLLLLIHDTFMEYELRALRSVVSGGHPPERALALLIEEIVVGAETFQQQQTIFFEQRRFMSSERFAVVKRKRDEFEQGVVDILEAGIEDGSFWDVASTRVLAFGIIGMSAWAYQWYRPGKMTAREIGHLYSSIVLSGLSTRSKPADRDVE